MNSKRWREVRAKKMTENPLCEECEKKGIVKPAQCVHHVTEIETAKTDAEAWDLTTSLNNLVSLCFDCHHKIHTQRKSHSKAMHKERNKTRLEQWAARHFANSNSALLVLVMLLTSCAAKRNIVNVAAHDTVRIVQKDSTIVNHRDSIYIREWQKGDTVYLTEYRERVAYRDRVRVDTFYMHRTDTVRVTPPSSGKSGMPLSLKFGLFIWGLLTAGVALEIVIALGKYRGNGGD